MGKVIAVGNQKGGVGKTTLVYNLAVLLSKQGSKVLMVDMDAQASLTESCGFEPQDYEKNNTNLFDLKGIDVSECIYDAGLELEGDLHIIPSTPLLASVELALIQARNREYKLKKALDTVKDSYDFILVDCMPSLSLVTINAITSADFLLISAGCSRLDHYALQLFLETVQGIKEDLNPDLVVLGTVASMYDSRAKEDREIVAELQENYSLLRTLRKTTEAKKYVKLGLPTVLGNPKSKLAMEYQDLVEKVVEEVERC